MSSKSFQNADKLRSIVSVLQFGAIGDGVADDVNAFKSAIQSLPTNGGVLVIPTGNYYLGSNPLTGTTGSRSIRYDISEGATFSGPGGAGGTSSNAGKFPTCITVGQIIPVGQYVTSRTLVDAAPTGAIAAFASEVFDGSSADTNQRIAVFGGAKLLGQGISSGANFVAQAMAGSSGKIWGLEVNVSTETTSGTSFGISINCTSQENITYGLKIDNSAYPTSPSQFRYGIYIRQSIIGLHIESTQSLENALLIGTPSTRYTNTLIQATQNKNQGSILYLERYTNTSPNGYLINAVNSGNSAQLFSVDINGSTLVKDLKINGAATAVGAGTTSIGNETTASASTPATTLGFIVGYAGGVKMKIPYYTF